MSVGQKSFQYVKIMLLLFRAVVTYNSEKNVNCYVLAYFAKHSGARDSIISHVVDLSLVCKQ